MKQLFLHTIILLFCSLNSIGQSIEIEQINSSSYFSDSRTIYPSAIKKINVSYKVIGNFTAYDSLNNPHQPFFIKDLHSNQFTYIEEQSGFLFYGFNCTDIVTDGKFNYTIGSVNNNTFICKTDKSGNIIWSKRESHHVNKDAIYDNGYIVVTNQDENSSGHHTILVSKIDTNGNLTDTINIFSGFGNDDAYKILNTTNGYIVIGDSYDGFYKQPYIIHLDKNLNYVWAYRYEEKKNTIITDAMINPVNNDIVITGFTSKSGDIDSTFLLITDQLGTLKSYKKYNDGTAAYKAVSLNISLNNNIYIGFNRGSEPFSIAPGILKLDETGNVIWGKSFLTDSSFVQKLTSSMLSFTEDSIYILGRIKDLSNPFGQYNSFYHEIIPLNNINISCNQSLNVQNSSSTLPRMSFFNSQNYLGGFFDYPFYSNTQNISISSKNCTITSVNEKINSVSKIVMSNNNKSIKINHLNNKKLNINIHTVSGTLIYSNTSSNCSIYTNEWTKGIYLININSEDQKETLREKIFIY